MRKFSVVIAAIATFCAVCAAQSLVKIPYSAKDKLDFTTLDIAFTRAGAYFLAVADDATVTRFAQQHIPYEVIHENLPEFYVSRFAPVDYGGYHTYAQIIAAIDSMQMLYPEIISQKFSIGTTTQGRDIWAIKISDNPTYDEDEPEVLFDFNIHAREVIGFELSLYFLSWLCDNYGTDPLARFIVDEREVFMVPVLNPDGVLINEALYPSGGGTWRKNTRDNNASGAFEIASDGVDLNRNFGYMWGVGGSSSTPSDDTYMGPSDFSEPETRAIRDFCAAHEIRFYMNVHSFSNYYLFPWGYTADHCADYDYFMLITDWMASRNGYVHGDAFTTIYMVSGGSFDWSYGEESIYGLSPEIGGEEDGFWPSTDRIIPLCEENLLACIVHCLVAGYAPRAMSATVSEISGDGDGCCDVGESANIDVSLINLGLDAASGVTVLARAITPGIIFIESLKTVSAPIAPKGGVATVSNFICRLAPPLLPGSTARVEFTVRTAEGYSMPDTLSFLVGTPLTVTSVTYDAGSAGWTLSGDWQIGASERPLPHSAPAILATRLNETYSNNRLSEAISPIFYIPTEGFAPELTFWQLLAIEGSAALVYDGGNVKIRRRGETSWRIIFPDGGYTGTCYTSNPHIGGEPAFSGNTYEWVFTRFPLDDFVGDSVQFKFVFGTDLYVGYEGWHIDDLSIRAYEPETTANIDEIVARPTSLNIHISPNPFNSICHISFAPIARARKLQIFDIHGKIVATQTVPSNSTHIAFDGANINSGLYLVTFEGETNCTKLILLE